MRFLLLLFLAATVSFASIGKITAIYGMAYAVRGADMIPLKIGSNIEKKDKIKTMKDSKLQIVFNDHTVISLGQKTEFKIDDYIFSKSKVKASFSVSKGIFKSITGKIGKIDHSKFKLKTKNATIGVRGTTFIGIVDTDKETIACTSGEIVVENDFGVVAVKRGEMTVVEEFQPPKIPKALSRRFIKKVKSVKPAINSDNVTVKQLNIANISSTIEKGSINEIFIAKDKDIVNIEEADGIINSGIAEKTQEIKSEKIQEIILSNVDKEFYTDKTKEESKQDNTKYESDYQEQTESNTITDINHNTANEEESITEKNTDNTKYESDYQEQTESNTITDINYDTTQEETSSTDQNTMMQEDVNKNEDDEGGDFYTTDMTQNNTNDNEVAEVSELDALKEKVGGVSNLHYEGRVSGENIVDEDNQVVLDVDLGKGSIDGNIKFTQRKQYMMMTVENNWDTKVAGSFTGGSNFSLNAVSDGYEGSGNVELQGEHLEDATGSMNLKKVENFMGENMTTSEVDISIDAHR